MRTRTLGVIRPVAGFPGPFFIGSAPTQHAAHKGIDDRQVKLGCVQPGENPANFGDALRRLSDQATYLYLDNKSYWYSIQPTVTRLAEDRAGQYSQHDIFEAIAGFLAEDARQRGDFVKVHPPLSGRDIPDEAETRLVILGPDSPHIPRDPQSPALVAAKNMLDSRGSAPRNYRNSLVFLVADHNRLKDLEASVRQYLAWKSIFNESQALELVPYQINQAKTQGERALNTVKSQIPEAFQWLLVPFQPNLRGEIVWEEKRLQGGEPLAVRAARKLKNEEMLLTGMGGIRLRMELDRVPLWRGNGDHVGIKQLAEDFARYLYLPRLRDSNVLISAIQG
ncbi:MAG: hypothetical protein MUF15_05855 [Acidobacteria bacterium]|nr:hypothetical protein [Acidobacteriota bacterium]